MAKQILFLVSINTAVNANKQTNHLTTNDKLVLSFKNSRKKIFKTKSKIPPNFIICLAFAVAPISCTLLLCYMNDIIKKDENVKRSELQEQNIFC